MPLDFLRTALKSAALSVAVFLVFITPFLNILTIFIIFPLYLLFPELSKTGEHMDWGLGPNCKTNYARIVHFIYFFIASNIILFTREYFKSSNTNET